MKSLVNFVKLLLASLWMKIFGGRGENKALLTDTAKVFPGSLPPDVCESLIGLIESIIENPASKRIWKDALESDTRVWCFEKDISELIDYFEIAQRIRAVDAYTGRSTRSWCLMANRVVPKKTNVGSGGGMHRDSPFSHQVKYIWYLNDVNENNGPFQYIPGTNINLLGSRKAHPLGQSRFHDLKEPAKEVHANAGSLLVCDTRCIHGGKPIKEGVRYAVTLYTFPQDDGVMRMLSSSGLPAS